MKTLSVLLLSGILVTSCATTSPVKLGACTPTLRQIVEDDAERGILAVEEQSVIGEDGTAYLVQSVDVANGTLLLTALVSTETLRNILILKGFKVLTTCERPDGVWTILRVITGKAELRKS